MEGFRLENADLRNLAEWFPKLSFERAEQLHALLHTATADFQAAPGSGKTTLLGAKLALIAKRWPYASRGLCVLSHTNVAKSEIEARLLGCPGGEQLLAYPHFIGTIQTFVNRYLALPWLRQLGIEVREVDDEAFNERFYEMAANHPQVKPWLNGDKFHRGGAIKAARYDGPDLQLVTTSDTPLPATGVCIAALLGIKNRLAGQGWLRYDDMFAYAERAIREVPGLAEAVAYRFPWVFIDEMQDTSDTQLSVLAKLFEGKVTLQRFGDVNQAILRRQESKQPSAFPRESFVDVSTSQRFGPEIAQVANRLRRVGDEIVGLGQVAAANPALCLYSDATVDQVVGRFGAWVATLFSQEEFAALPVKALCAVRRPGNLKQAVGRHLPDYFPSYDVEAGRPTATRQSACTLVREAGKADASPAGFAKRVTAAREAVIRMLRAYGDPDASAVSSWVQLCRALSVVPLKIQAAEATALLFIRNAALADTEPGWRATVEQVRCAFTWLRTASASALQPLPQGLEFVVDAPQAGTLRHNRLLVSECGKTFELQLSTIAAAKGETHLATLVLEACFGKRFDLEDLLPYLSGTVSARDAEGATTRGQLQNVFVGVTRASRLVAIAMHSDRADARSRELLQAQGWQVFDWTSPAGSA